jgi:hypothetical protein
MSKPSLKVIVCNKADIPSELSHEKNIRILSYDPQDIEKNVVRRLFSMH